MEPFPFPGIPGWMQRWAERNECAMTPHDSALSATTTRRTYPECDAGADVVLYTQREDGHVWPGGGRLPKWMVGIDTRSIDATSVMWDFFSRLQRDVPRDR